jgi:rare lipoprotein A
VQVGAFADPANARQAADRLSAAGVAVIEPVARDGMTFYRVFLPAPADEAEAFALRDQAQAYGFADARVVRPAGL